MKLPRWATQEIWRRVMPNRGCDFTVGDDQMRRWHLLPRSRWFSVYLHKFVKSDVDEALHDHPYLFNITIILRGSYTEQTVAAGGVVKKTIFPEGTVRVRLGPSPHRIELHDGRAWTIFITGPRYREWGFHCPQGWKPYKAFLASEAKNGEGRGCGED